MGRRTFVIVAAAVLAAFPFATTASVARADAEVCNKECDALDPSKAVGDRTPVSTTLHGRTIALHVDDGNAMGWATIDGAGAGDEIWLDRSFDGGKTWSKLGLTEAPEGYPGWRSQMYNVDDWNNRGIGALRACGRAADRPEIACTQWARSDWNASSPGKAAATALMMLFDRDTGLFESNGWWTSANALTAVIDNIRATGMRSYEYAIAETYDRNLDGHGGNFTNEFLDDTGWWGLAWVAAYDLTGDNRYLETAKIDADHMNAHWTSECGGGVTWKTDNGYKNAVTNELFLHLNAALHNRIPGDTEHLARAQREWDWFRDSGMINADNLVNDGLDGCQNNGQPTWTYNQGILLGGLAELHRATGDEGLLEAARELADASTTAESLHKDGVLTEPCEPNNCDPDGPSFKGAYVRGLGALNDALPDHPYSDYLKRQADSAYANRSPLDMYGVQWNAPADRISTGRQHSALDLFNMAY
ncbi:glycoside hydrolase family 76 protein [Saccharopolyspora indica]|uniref:glycoside hydrolase family 76 protein n=1 Tax=Saccharopolyspora indica TaxID=1229659 RepID=UPI0022EA6DB0|nr:glycoside hydrolase family 76 protein [Saccharopolyspora indica]MDA3646793.1 glycosyl hydrolase [Saccharopolyspora indica]